MGNFTGLPCPVCGVEFLSGDDIVVCPECGAPYHRACYQAQGRCVLDDLHKTGGQWQPPAGAAPQGQPEEHAHGQSGAVCPRCGAENAPGALLCQNCGWRLDAGAPGAGGGQWGFPGQFGPQGGGYPGGQQPYGQGPAMLDAFFQQGCTLDEELTDGVTYKEAGDFVGPNRLKFLMKFRALASGAAVSFNWSAFLFTFFYCFYRKMYKLGAALLAVTLVVFIPTTIFTTLYYTEVMNIYGAEAFLNPLSLPVVEGQWLGLFQLFGNLSNLVSIGVAAAAGILFNKLYLKETVRQVKAVREKGHYSTGSAEYSYVLVRSGGVTVGPVLVLLAGYSIANFLSAFFVIT